MTDKYNVQDVFDFAAAGKPVEFENAVTLALQGKAAEAISAYRQELRADLFRNGSKEQDEGEPNDEPDLPEEDEEEADGGEAEDDNEQDEE